MADRDYISLVSDLVKECENYRDTLSADRIKATEYYDGVMNDTPSDKGRSSVVSRDVRSTVQKVLPVLTRLFLGSDRIVEFQPAQEGDEEKAEQATDYINDVVFAECGGEDAVTHSIHDALKTRNGVLTWWYDEKKRVSVSRHTGLDETAFATLASEEGVDVLEHTERQEEIEGPEGPVPTVVHDLKLRRSITERKPMLQCIPLEEFLIHPDALDEDTAPCIGRKTRLRRTDLVAMGYDKDVVRALPVTGADGQQEEVEELTRRKLIEGGKNELAPELQEIDYYDVYVRLDMDDDGIAELRRMCFGGKVTEQGLLMNEEVDEIPYSIVAVKTQPHVWEGISVADDMMDLQRVKTVLLRGTLDNLYWQNNMQIAMQQGAVVNADAVSNPQFGQTIWLNDGFKASEAMQPIPVPFVASQSFEMLGYMDKEGRERTGISDASGGLPPDALQNVTAKASALLEQQQVGQADLMARTLAAGFKRAFKGLLRLVVRHQDKPRVVRLRNEWVTFDPRQWNADMDCSVNTGLGAGTRERDMTVMMQVMGLQKEVIAAMGQSNPFVTPENIGNALFKVAEAAGLKTPRLFFSKPTPEQIQGMIEGMKNKPDPEMMKIQATTQAEMQIKQMELNLQKELKQLEMQANTQKEIAQSQAAVEERTAVVAIEAQDKDKDRALKQYEIDERNRIEWAKLGVTRETAEANILLKLKQEQDAKAAAEQAEMKKSTERQEDIERSSKPKRVQFIRDENGELAGAEQLN